MSSPSSKCACAVQEIEQISSDQSGEVSLETEPIVALGRFALFALFRLPVDSSSYASSHNAFALQQFSRCLSEKVPNVKFQVNPAIKGSATSNISKPSTAKVGLALSNRDLGQLSLVAQGDSLRE